MKSLDKVIFYIESDLIKGETEVAQGIGRKIARKIDQDSNYLEQHPEHAKYRDSDPEINRRKEKENKDEFTEYESPLEVKSVVKGKDGHVASVAVKDGSKLLMGKRRDNGRYTMPGGHLEEGESKHEGARRELKEEAGINLHPSKFKHLGSEKIKTYSGKEKTIHAFTVDHDGSKPNSKNDPDKEVEKWEWIETKSGLPKHVAENLHSPENPVLKKLGLQKSLFVVGADPTFFVRDIIKGGTHKYLRKYQRGGKWIYVYHESHEHPGRQIPEDVIHHLKELAETHGDEHAKKLLETLEAHSEEKLKLLRELADTGDQEAHKHLNKLGIDRHAEKLEEKLIPAEMHDPIDKPFESAEAKQKAADKISSAFHESVHGYLAQHTNTPHGQKIQNVKMNDLHSALQGANSLSGMLKAAHEHAKKIDEAHAGLPESRNDAARSAGGYGNLGYNKAVKALESAGILPEGYTQVHSRTKENSGDLKPHPIRGLAEAQQRRRAEEQARQERERQEREERERRELAGVHGSMAHHMSSLMERPMESSKIIELNRALKSIFGKDVKKSDWPYNFEEHGLKVKIQHMSVSHEGVSLRMQVFDKDGNPMMEMWERGFEKKNGRPDIHNYYMAVKPSARGSVQVGNLINQGQRRLLRSLPQGGTISVYAALDVGGYNWANQGFSFDSPRELQNYRDDFQRFCASKGINLTPEDLRKFTSEVHFAAFKDGKKYVKTLGRDTQLPLSAEQIRTKSLTNIDGEHSLTPEEIRSGKTNRMVCHLGKLFMLGRAWHGTWDSKENTIASKYADQYYQLRDRASKFLEPEWQNIEKEVKEGRRVAAVEPERITRRELASRVPGSTSPAGQSSGLISFWSRSIPGRGTPRIRMTKQRIQRVLRMSQPEIDHFISNAPITRAARSQIRNAMRNRGAR